MKNWAKVFLGIGVTGALLSWVLADVPFAELLEDIRQSNRWLLLASATVVVIGHVIRAMRWNVLLVAVKPNSKLQSRIAAVSIHFMANNILPLRVGEFARAWVFGRLEAVSPSAAFGTVIVERFMDAVVLLIFLIVPVFMPGFPNPDLLSSGWGGLLLKGGIAAAVVILVALVTAVAAPRFFSGLAESIAPILPRRIQEPLLNALESFLGSLTILRDPKFVTIGFVWTFGFWAWHAISFWLGMLAFGIDTGYVSALFTTAVVAFGVAIPSAPGFLGTFQVAAVFALRDVYGATSPQSLAFAFGYFFVSWLPITLIGLVFAWKLGLSLGDVRSSEERIQ